jgi:nucleotide-binding universal stress UspA family protein
MSDYRKVLVAFDGSTASKNALRQAFALGTWIKVLAVVPDYAGDIDLTGISQIKDITHGLGQSLLTEAMAIALEEKTPILTNLDQGEPYERIVHVADNEKCDLIVMGRKGLSRLERALMGRVTARVIGYTSKDVLVVPLHGTVHLHEMLLATDGSPNTTKAVSRALSMAGKYKARLTLLSVVYTNIEFLAHAPDAVNKLVQKARSQLETIAEKAHAEGIETRIMVRQGDPHVAIAAVSAEIGAGLIIMGSHGRKSLTRLLMGSVAEQVIGSATMPVLVCHHYEHL